MPPELLANPLLVGLLVGVPSFALGFLAYRRSVKVDKAAEQAVIAAAHTTAIGQVLTGLNQLIDTLQEDNRELRAIASELGVRLKAVIDERDAAIAELRQLRSTLGVSE